MKIWVDADACPKPVKNTLFKAAERVKAQLILVANHAMNIPTSPYISLRLVPQGFDVADNYIVEQLQVGDVLITSDIPLAADAVAKGVHVLSSRGQCFDKNNIAQRLRVRNMLEEMRNAGQIDSTSSGPQAFSQSDLREFANALDRLLTKIIGA